MKQDKQIFFFDIGAIDIAPRDSIKNVFKVTI